MSTRPERILALRQALSDLEAVSEEDYPDLRSRVLAAGGDGFREGVRTSMVTSYEVTLVPIPTDPDDLLAEPTEQLYEEQITVIEPDENNVSRAGLMASLKTTLQICLTMDWYAPTQ